MADKKPALSLDNVVADQFKDLLLESGRVKISGIGIFEIKRCKGHGERTLHGRTVNTAAYNKLSFKPSANLKRAIKAYAG